MKSAHLTATFLSVCSLILTGALAQELGSSGFSVPVFTVDGGGGTSSGGVYVLTGTIGQPDAGAAMTGGGFQVSGGFWPAALPPVPDCVGDVNNNGLVNIDDLVIVITSWNQTSGPGDVNGDHIVNIDDLVQVIVHWGMCP